MDDDAAEARQVMRWAWAPCVVAAAAGLSAQQTPVFRSVAEAVLLPVAVTINGRPVGQLTSADFEVLDNGVRQTVESATIEALAIDVTLLADVSGSVDGAMLERFKQEIQDIARAMPSDDRARLVTFGASVQDVTGWQPGGAPLPLDRVTAGGGTSLYDALAAVLLASRPTARPHLIVGFSDGLDTTSLLDAAAVGRLAGRTQATVFLSLVRAPQRPLRGAAPWSGQPDVRLLRDVAERTGGDLYEHRSSTGLAQEFRRVLDTFRTMYLLRYTPSGVEPGGWHALTVRVPGRSYQVRARPGYDGG